MSKEPQPAEIAAHVSTESAGSSDTLTYVRPTITPARKWFMLFLFCLAEGMDSFIGSGLFPAISIVQKDLNIGPTEITWAFAAYSATFAAFLLISGRVADVYSARMTFIVGAFVVGAFSLGGGFPHDKTTFFVLRAFAGIGAALTVPSALSLIIEWFPEPDEQNLGIALFGGTGGLGNIFGVIFSGIFVEWASWRWILWLTGILGMTIALLAALVVPPSAPRRHKPTWKRLDLIGVSSITAAFILFIYAVTSGSVDGWGSANVIAPLVISVIMIAAFFVWEARIDPELAALPPRIWKYPNVPILVTIALMPFFWWCGLFFQQMPRFESVYHWSPLMTSVRFLPNGIVGMVVSILSSKFVKYASPKWTILGGLTWAFVATMLLPFADTSDKFWSYMFPAFLIGTPGTIVVYTNSNIAIFMNTPPEIAGVVGGIFNAALQLSTGLGAAIVSSISTSIDQKRASKGILTPGDYHGIAAAYWFIVGWIVVIAGLILVFYEVEPQWKRKAGSVEEGAKDTIEEEKVAVEVKDDIDEKRELEAGSKSVN